MTDPDAEAFVSSTFKRLDELRARTRKPFRPEAGTELAADDLDWPSFPMSQVAVSSMSAAVDHIQAFRVHAETDERFSFAHPTLLRTALLASAQAVWVLASEESDVRRARARTLAFHVNAEHVKFLKDLQSLTPESHANTDEVAVQAAARLDELRVRRTSAGQSEKFEATRVIETAAEATWVAAVAAAEARVEWRRGSAAAHGLMWAVMGHRENRVTLASDGGLAAIEVGGNLDAVVNLYACAWNMLQNAYRLLDLRGRTP